MQFENTNWKRPARRPLNAVTLNAVTWRLTWRHRIAAAMSSAMTHIVSDFAFAAAGMYPDLLWPLIDHVNSRDSMEEPSPGRRASERNWNRMSHSHEVFADLPGGAGTRRFKSQTQERRATMNNRIQLDSLPRLVATSGNSPRSRRWAAAQSDEADVRQGSYQRRPSVGVSETWRLLGLWGRVGNLLRPSVAAWIASLASLSATLWSRLLREREMRRSRAELEVLDDRTLKDIGLSRHEIELIVRGEGRWR
jgi:uncharacterized protein YjiS (DUF1127 family)